MDLMVLYAVLQMERKDGVLFIIPTFLRLAE